MASRRRLAQLSLVTTVLTLLTVTAGGLVRASHSGLGCPGWPRCHGSLIPPADHHAIIEMSHRYLVVISSTAALLVTLVVLIWHRRDRLALGLSLPLLPLFAAQAAIGAYVVNKGVPEGRTIAWTVVAHLGMAMIVVATLVLLRVHLVTVRPGGLSAAAPPPGDRIVLVPAEGSSPARLVRPAAAAGAATYLLLLLGSYVTGRDAGLAFRDWPLMGGRVVPAGLHHLPPLLQFGHRLGAVLAGALVAWVVVRARPVRGAAGTLARVAGGLFLLQVLVGGLNVFSHLHSAVVTTHLALSALIWATLVALWGVARRTSGAAPAPAAHPHRAAAEAPAPERAPAGAGLGAGQKVLAYVALTKPRIIELLLVTTVPTMVVAARGLPSGWLVVATVLGGTLAAGGANAINMYFDRDIDKLMNRTRKRPLVTGVIEPTAALVFAVTLEAVAFVELWLLVNLLSALLAVGATLFYVFVYTLWLKRSSSQNIVIGGAAGAVPVLVGWSAVTGSLGVAPLVLFALIFWWTPPHFWALAIRYRDDYDAADVPMLPCVVSMAATARRILAYTVLLWAVSLLFYSVAGMGAVYLAAALILGGGFTYQAVQLLRQESAERAMRVFSYSISYISLLFGAMAVDRLLHL